MKTAIITCGMGYGDEGKGSIVDYLCRTRKADLTIRYSGGPQCGHNVTLEDGTVHCFSQYGAGSLAGVPSYTHSDVIIDPIALHREYDALSKLCKPQLSIHENCLVATPYHRLLNRHKETIRGESRHGSCGAGVGETRSYWLKYGQDAIFLKDLFTPNILWEKLKLLRQRILDETFVRSIYDLYPEMIVHSKEYDANQLPANIIKEVPEYTTCIYEGAQGVLLDENFGFPPHNTWSTVTTFNAYDIAYNDEVETVGIVRAYQTRHGAGPLPTYDEELTRVVNDTNNPTNAWQGSFRCGWLDLGLLTYALNVQPVDYIAVNGVDQLPSNPKVSTGIYYWVNDKDKFGNKRFQEEVSSNLEYLSNNTKNASYPILDPVAEINKLAPVRILGLGPAARDKLTIKDYTDFVAMREFFSHLVSTK